MDRMLEVIVEITAVLGIVMLTVLGFNWEFNGNSVKEEKVKIGFVIPLTGPASYIGEQWEHTIVLAEEDLTGKDIEFIIEDGATDVERSISAANKLINIDKVEVIFSSLTGTSNAIAPLAESRGVIHIYESTTKSTAVGKENVFSTFPSARDFCRISIENSIKRGVEKIAYLTDLTGGGEECMQGIIDSGVDLVADERFDTKDPDFRTALSKIKSAEPEGLVIYTYGHLFKNIYQQMVNLDLETKLICPFTTSTCAGNEEAYDLALKNELLDGATGSYFYFNPGSDSEFSVRYKERYGINPTGFAAHPYEDIMMISSIIEECGSGNEDCLRAGLLEIKHDGVTGLVEFDSEGVAEVPIRGIVFSGNEWIES